MTKLNHPINEEVMATIMQEEILVKEKCNAIIMISLDIILMSQDQD
jgi:hypothetical protein